MKEKLVRDRIPTIFGMPTTSIRVATDDELERLLAAKLVEEAHGFQESGEAEELADVLEVIAAIADRRRLSAASLERMRIDKASERGGFSERLIWSIPDEVDEPWAVPAEGEGGR